MALATLLAASLSLSQRPDHRMLALMAASEFRATGTEEELRASVHYHKKALIYFRSCTVAELRKDLEPVYNSYRLDTMEACGAAYVLALHGVDVDKNVTRLSRVKQYKVGASESVESLPEALADTTERRLLPSSTWRPTARSRSFNRSRFHASSSPIPYQLSNWLGARRDS